MMFKKALSFLIIVILMLFISISVTNAGDLQQGLEYYNSGEYKKAEIYFRKIVNQEPANYSAKYMLAASLVYNRNYNEARDLYKNVILNSTNDRLVSLSQTGLSNIGGSIVYRNRNNVSKAVINVNKAGTIMIVDNVILNNQLSTSFIFDTGATFTTISRATADRLNISTRGAKKVRVMTASGYINAPMVKIASVEVKGLVAKNIEAIITDLPAHGSDNQIAGLLGLSFLENFKITVDRSAGRITLEKD